jgi:hypothetical protein
MIRNSTRTGCSCQGKRTYSTIGEALRAMPALLDRKRKRKHRTKPYHCNVCQGYHLTGSFESRIHFTEKGGPPNARIARKKLAKRFCQHRDAERRQFARTLVGAPA